jgi:RNA polymerase sigma-70 factor, ECF subfamily
MHPARRAVVTFWLDLTLLPMSINKALSDLDTPTAFQLSDEEIVARVRSGDTALYEILMRRYNQRLFRIARSILRNDNEAEDVMQETYVRAFSSLHQFAGKAQFSTWLAKIAVYESSARLQEKKRFQEFPAKPGGERPDMEFAKSPTPDPEAQTLNCEAVSFLEQAIDALPDLYRSVFVLRDVEELNTAETAACLDVKEETVKVRLMRAREMLRNELYARAGATSSRAFLFLGARCDRIVRGVIENLRTAGNKY